jgi:hypothetical protein
MLRIVQLEDLNRLQTQSRQALLKGSTRSRRIKAICVHVAIEFCRDHEAAREAAPFADDCANARLRPPDAEVSRGVQQVDGPSKIACMVARARPSSTSWPYVSGIPAIGAVPKPISVTKTPVRPI